MAGKTTTKRLLRYIFITILSEFQINFIPTKPPQLKMYSILFPQLLSLSALYPPHHRFPEVGCCVRIVQQFVTNKSSSRPTSCALRYIKVENLKSQQHTGQHTSTPRHPRDSVKSWPSATPAAPCSHSGAHRALLSEPNVQLPLLIRLWHQVV